MTVLIKEIIHNLSAYKLFRPFSFSMNTYIVGLIRAKLSVYVHFPCILQIYSHVCCTYTIIAIKVSKMKKVTSQALYKKNIEIKEKKKKINESSDDF